MKENKINEPQVVLFQAGNAIFVHSHDDEIGECHVKVSIDEIESVTYSERQHQCNIICMSDTHVVKTILTDATIEELMAVLPSDTFAQIHWNQIVNLKHIDKFQGKTLYARNTIYTIDSRYAENAHMLFKAKSIINSTLRTTVNDEDDALFVLNGKTYHRVNLSKFTYISSDNNYTFLHVIGLRTPICTIYSMNKWMNMLPPTDFIRVDRSHILNIHHIDRLSATALYIGDRAFPIPRRNTHIITDFFTLIRRQHPQ